MRPSLARTLVVRSSLVAVAALAAAMLEHFRKDGVELHYELDAVSAAIQKQVRISDGRIQIHLDSDLRAWLDSIPDLHLAVLDDDEQPVFVWRAEAGDRVFKLARMSDEGQVFLRSQGPDRPRFGYVTRLEVPGRGPLRLVADRAPAELRDRWVWAMTEIRGEYGPFVLGGALVSILVVLFSVRQALRPVTRVSQELRKIHPGEPKPLQESGLPVEIVPFVQAVNQALTGLHEAFHQQRRFAGDVAHTLRTPLAAMRAQIEALEPSELRTMLLRSVARMERLVGQLLSSARLDTIGEERPELIDVNRLIHELVADAAPGLLAAGASPVLEAPREAIEVPVPRLAVEQALLNLLDNAAKASPPGAAVEIRLERTGMVWVRDHGPGLPAELIEQLRRKGPLNLRSSWQGAGLGLSIVRKAVEAMGAELVARNHPDGGAEIGLRLPVSKLRKLPASMPQRQC